MGRTAVGVRGMSRLQGSDEVVGMEILSPGATVLTVTETRIMASARRSEDYRCRSAAARA